MNLKKILILSAGVFVIIAGLVVFFLMPDGEVSPVTAEAQQLVQVNKDEEALLLLIKNKEGLDDTGVKLIGQLQSEIYNRYVTEAQKAIDEEDFVLAYETYQTLLQFAPEKDIETIQKNLRGLEKIVTDIKALEKAYTSYLITFEKALNDSNSLLVSFKSALDKYEIGVYTANDFKKEFTSKIDVSNGILTTLDSGLKTNNQNLLSIHKDMVNLMNQQHNMLLASLQVKGEDKSSAINKFKKTYLDIKEEQISIIQSLQEFSIKHNLGGSVISDTGEIQEQSGDVTEAEIDEVNEAPTEDAEKAVTEDKSTEETTKSTETTVTE